METAGTKCVDEISNYLEGRYVSATEACYRIFAYDFHANLPHVLRLAVHLENKQPVYFSEQAELKDVLSKQRDTTLTGWFVANQSFHSAKEITYTNFPDKFVCDKSERKWKPRVKGHPVEGERFYLRMLLNHVTGCTSFQCIRTLADGTVCESYKEAARSLGLLEDDKELDECLTDETASAMPPQMRQLFVTILLFNVPTDPLVHWENHKASLAEDFLQRAKVSVSDVQLDEHILNSVLLDIKQRLEKHGKSLSDYPGMPMPRNIRNRYEEPRVIQDELDADQLIIFNTIMKVLNDSDVYPKVFFIDGPDGTGKTFLYYTLLAKVRSRRDCPSYGFFRNSGAPLKWW